VPGTDDVDEVEAMVRNQPLQMGEDEVDPRGRPPMAEESRLDVLAREGLS
jgi:hypothetical protein